MLSIRFLLFLAGTLVSLENFMFPLGQIRESSGEVRRRFFPPGLEKVVIRSDGDLMIGFIPYYTQSASSGPEPCADTVGWKTMLKAYSLNYALDKANMRSDILPNIKLGFVILDACYDDRTATLQALKFLPNQVNRHDQAICSNQPTGNNTHVQVDEETASSNQPTGNSSDLRADEWTARMCFDMADDGGFYDVVGVIAPGWSSGALAVSRVLMNYRIPVMADEATSDTLSDTPRYDYFMRVVPPDRFQAKAVVDVIRYFKWSYMSILFDDNNYGQNGAKRVKEEAEKYGICVAVMMPADVPGDEFDKK